MNRSAALRRPLPAVLLALCLPGAAALAQTPAPAAPVSGEAPSQVIVAGKKLMFDPTQFNPADSPVYNPQLASSCNFMAAYDPRYDEVTRRYMRDFAPTGGTVSDVSPHGDASTGAVDTARAQRDEFGNGAEGTCGRADRAFAAGRNHIARKDKTFAAGLAAFRAKDYPTAIAQFELHYKKIGTPEAALLMARIYLNNMGGKGDPAKAIYWYKQVAEARRNPSSELVVYDPAHPEALSTRTEAYLSLAQIYMLGLGVPVNPAEARKWYEKASDLNYSPATNTLAGAWLKGYGGRKDARTALSLYKKAGEEGYVAAQYNAGRMYYLGAEGVPQDLKAAGAWFVTAARSGHTGALYAVARMLDLGEGVKADPAKALVYYKAAALKANPAAQNAVATYFYRGDVVAQDLGMARKWFDVAAKKGEPDAMFNLAAMYLRGEGGDKDLSSAYVWLALSKQAGHEVPDGTLAQLRSRLSEQEKAKADAILRPAKS